MDSTTITIACAVWSSAAAKLYRRSPESRDWGRLWAPEERLGVVETDITVTVVAEMEVQLGNNGPLRDRLSAVQPGWLQSHT